MGCLLSTRNASLTTSSSHLMSHFLIASKDTSGGIQCLFSDIDGKMVASYLLRATPVGPYHFLVDLVVNFLFYTPG